jgi:lysophospholipase L1-like esterase
MATPAISQDAFHTGEGGPLKTLPPATAAGLDSILAGAAPSVTPLEAFTIPPRPRHILLTKPAQTIICVLLLAALPWVVPELGGFRAYWPSAKDFVTFHGSTSGNLNDLPGGAPDGNAVALPVAPAGSGQIEDPQGLMRPFYQSLAASAAKQPDAITRIIHYGDSPLSADLITGTVRRKMQARFGDAGHGFILASRPWAWYNHDAIMFTGDPGWISQPLLGAKLSDGFYGLGGVSSKTVGAGRFARYSPAETGEFGKTFSRIEVYYLKQPNGGSFSIFSSDGGQQTVNTNDQATASGFAELRASAPGGHTFELKTTGGQVRLFGAVVENNTPGVVYDTIGVTGAYAGLLARDMNEQHWAEQLQHRNPNLVIINYGTNESQYDAPENFVTYENDLREVVRRVRAALPKASLLIMSPPDRGKRAAGGIITHPAIPKIVEMQRRVAQETGCAFFDTYAAMGGEGTMARWYAGVNGTKMVGGDLMHPTPTGAEFVGQLIYDALTRGYEGYQQAQAQAQAQATPKK